MKFAVDREDFLAALDAARKVTPGAKTSPATSTARIVAGGDTLTIFATDLSVFMARRMVAGVSQIGEVGVVPADLAEMVRRMPDGARITFSVTGHRAKVSGDGTKRSFTLSVIDTIDMPTHSGVSPAGKITVAGDVLAAALKRAIPSAYQDVDRAHMCGIAFDGRGQILRLASTDGHRVVACDVDGASGHGDVRLLHLGAARVLASEASTMTNVGIVVDDRGFSFTSDRVSIFVPHVGANFPPYDALFASHKWHTAVTLVVANALEASHAMLAVSKTTKISLDDCVRMSANGEHESVDDELDSKPAGPGGAVFVSTPLLIDALKGSNSSDVEMRIGDDPNPIVLISHGYKALIMPIRPGTA